MIFRQISTPKLIAFTLLLCLALTSCKKKYPNCAHVRDCHDEQNWTDTELQTKMLGAWEWSYMVCAFGYEKDKEYRKGLRIEFRADSTVYAFENGMTDTARWYIADGLMEIEPRTSGTSELPYFCDDLLMFEGTFNDGCSHFYRRGK